MKCRDQKTRSNSNAGLDLDAEILRTALSLSIITGLPLFRLVGVHRHLAEREERSASPRRSPELLKAGHPQRGQIPRAALGRESMTPASFAGDFSTDARSVHRTAPSDRSTLGASNRESGIFAVGTYALPNIQE